MTKRGNEVANAVQLLESLLDEVKEPTNDAELQMYVKYWTAYAICKADHSARVAQKLKLLTDVNKKENPDEGQRSGKVSD
jgi:hypothetical protein